MLVWLHLILIWPIAVVINEYLALFINQCRGNCSENGGIRTRTVECRADRGNEAFPDNFCHNQSRPIDTEQCMTEGLRCLNCTWEAGPWSEVCKRMHQLQECTQIDLVSIIILDNQKLYCIPNNNERMS